MACVLTVAAGYVAHRMNGTMPVGTVLHLVQKYLNFAAKERIPATEVFSLGA